MESITSDITELQRDREHFQVLITEKIEEFTAKSVDYQEQNQTQYNATTDQVHSVCSIAKARCKEIKEKHPV